MQWPYNNVSLVTCLGILAGLTVGSSIPRNQTQCTSLTLSETPAGTTLINTTAMERCNVTVEGTSASLEFCAVEVYLTHGDAGDVVRVAVWLPLDNWNGRWQGTGGAGLLAGLFDNALAPAIAAGYAAGSTDAGVGLVEDSRAWANSTQLVANFVYLSIHDMTVVGKDLATKFYGQKPAYSYFTGCSEGGREGYSQAQLHPEDYDGIMAVAPAINWDRLLPALLWPWLRQSSDPEGFVPICKLSAITNSSISACDLLDGGQDGHISNPLECDFVATSVIGQEAMSCETGDKTITERDATVWNDIRDGPKNKDGESLWYGNSPGSDLLYVAQEAPLFPAAEMWQTDFLLRAPDFNLSELTYDQYITNFEISVSQFGALWGTDDPDLTAFKEGGGKLLTWHGWADQTISVQGTLDYWQRVVDVMDGGRDQGVDDFYRVFLAPGVGHCGIGGYGPLPADPLAALVSWVENGTAPDTLSAAGLGQTRNLCKHPAKLVYKGVGDVRNAESWTCI